MREDKVSLSVIKNERTRSVESLVDNVSFWVLLLGIVTSVLAFTAERMPLSYKILNFVQILTITFVVFSVMRAIAEMVRLLKHSNKIQYEDLIAQDGQVGICVSCSQYVYGDRPKYCSSCGVEFHYSK